MATTSIVIVSGLIVFGLILLGALRWLLHRHYRDVPLPKDRHEGAGKSPLDI